MGNRLYFIYARLNCTFLCRITCEPRLPMASIVQYLPLSVWRLTVKQNFNTENVTNVSFDSMADYLCCLWDSFVLLASSMWADLRAGISYSSNETVMWEEASLQFVGLTSNFSF